MLAELAFAYSAGESSGEVQATVKTPMIVEKKEQFVFGDLFL